MEPATEWFSTTGFMPHGYSFLWNPALLWSFVIAEAVIALAFFSILPVIAHFTNKRRDHKSGRLALLLPGKTAAAPTGRS